MDKKKSDEPVYVTRSSMPSYEEYIEAIMPLWDSHWLTNMGEYHQKLEKKLMEYLNVEDISLMVNGHMALELAIQSFSFPEGSEIITSPFTFISTTHAIVRNKLSPVFCDVKKTDGTIDESKIEDLISEKTVAILPIHVYGNICNVYEIEDIACRYGLKVIYDAAHAFGVDYDGKGIGSFGDASVFSFHATKVFNTIEGGAVTFSDHWIYEKLYNLKNFGIHGEELVTDIGANAKMNEFCAIMGLCNLKHIDEAMQNRKKAYDQYMTGINQIDGIDVFERDEKATNNYAYFPIIVNDDYKYTRDELYNKLRSRNIFPRKYFCPATADNVCFKNKYREISIPNARELANRVLTLPLFDGIEGETVDRILSML